jgi:uncharacterized damage-inducible protein DinB
MSRMTRLANHIERTLTGPMWHGPALLEVLKDVGSQQARARPFAAGHTIWELVLHITAWSNIGRQRLRGEATADPTAAEDWPPVPGDDSTWRAAIDDLSESHRRLAADTRGLSEQQLRELVPGLDYTVAVMLHGIIEHGTYHGGQIALLKKA